uniref:ATP-binding protein n=1 Tax=uncultured marine group II/III euryarchaeote KM3_92_B07 TaxID=1456543 RepID=A0A075I1J4_9EURY|nr:hypothetical protein [uncultured marine group II/III euryarchaeote KM3_92_B07]
MSERREPFVNQKGAIDSLRRHGIKVPEGICELIDNALDAGARHIRVHIDRLDNGRLHITVADDGDGVPDEVPGDPTMPAIMHVLRFGGRLQHPRRGAIGRFGWGLSQTATSLSVRTVLLSKTDGTEWRTCYIDLDELKQDTRMPKQDSSLMPRTEDIPPGWGVPQTGTVVILAEVDKHDYRSSVELAEGLVNNLGRTYRHHLHRGMQIEVTYSEEDGDEAISKSVPLRDPLCQMPGSLEEAEFGVMDDWMPEPMEFVFDGKKGPFSCPGPPITDPDTGEFARITVRLILVDVKRVYEALGIVENGLVVTQGMKRKLSKWGFNRREQGFSLVRSGREIKSGYTFGLFQKTDRYNMLRGEISFPAIPEVDDWFSIQNNKSRFFMDQRLKDKMDAQLRSTMAALRNKHASERKKVLSVPRQGPITRISDREKVAATLREVVKRTPIPADELNRKLAQLEARKNQVKLEVKQAEQAKVDAAKSALDVAKAGGRGAEVKTAEVNLKQAESDKDERVIEVRNLFNVPELTRMLEPQPMPGHDDLYVIEDFHDEVWIRLNASTQFYSKFYLRACQYPEVKSLIDMMLMGIGMAHAEMAGAEEVPKNEQMAEFWNDARRTISSVMHVLLRMERYDGDALDAGASEAGEEPELVTLDDFL